MRVAFIGAVIVIAAMMGVRVWNLRLLYVDSALRSRAVAAVTAAAEREGWLLSDVTILRVESDTLRIRHRFHLRHPMSSMCFTVDLASSALTSCAD